MVTLDHQFFTMDDSSHNGQLNLVTMKDHNRLLTSVTPESRPAGGTHALVRTHTPATVHTHGSTYSWELERLYTLQSYYLKEEREWKEKKTDRDGERGQRE